MSSSKFGVRYYPAGFVFDIAGSSIFPNSEKKFGYLLGFLASEVAFNCLKITNSTINFQVGDVRMLPLVYDENNFNIITKISNTNVTLSQKDWNAYETSWDFKKHPLV